MDKKKNNDLLKIEQLRKTIFNMLNYANMYVLVLDQAMIIRYANNSLAIDLGFDNYRDIVGKCWLEFLTEAEKKNIIMIHKKISDGEEDWEKYKEFRNYIQSKSGQKILVHWFNSHINTEFNWSFSFGISKKPVETMVTMESIRNYYRDIIEKDKTMIEAMKDMIIYKNSINTCEGDLK